MTTSSANTLFSPPAESQSSVDRWGAMAADVVFLSADKQRLTLVESKVDSHFTHGDSPPDGQLSRYLEFLEWLSPRKTCDLLLVFPRCNEDWYTERLRRAVKHEPDSRVSAAGRKVGGHLSGDRSQLMGHSQSDRDRSLERLFSGERVHLVRADRQLFSR